MGSSFQEIVSLPYKNRGFSVDVVYLDIAKAFDRVPHQRLFLKFKAIGLSGCLLNWCCDFVTNRKQKVVMDSYSGSWHDIISGVPHGSVLGPLFFIIYINDLLTSISIPCKGYADDTKIISVNDSINQHILLQENLDRVFQWTIDWQLGLNVNKCKIMYFGTKKQLKTSKTFHINGSSLTPTASERDLGVIITPDLDFKEHINRICSISNFKVKQLKKCFRFKSIKFLLFLFNVMIRPTLDYANIIWNPSNPKQIRLIENVQRRLSKFGNISALPATERYEKLGLISLQNRRLKNDLIQYFRYKVMIKDINMALPTNKDTRTRGSHKLTVSSYSRPCRRNFFSCRIVQLWNSLPESVHQISSVEEFKNFVDSLAMFSRIA
jgi:hypothetical protein